MCTDKTIQGTYLKSPLLAGMLKDKIYPTKKRNAISQVTGQFLLYRCKGMPVTVVLHIFCSQVSKMC